MTTRDVDHLARVHAALGEPVRLRLVEQLVLGDRSPGELGAAFGLATNLLAFHLRALADAGIVRRLPSQGDRRRSYVQLCWEDAEVVRLAPPAPALPAPIDRVVFVCTRNSARSQLAAAGWARLSRVPATSAGTDPAPAVHPGAVAAGRRHGLRLARAGTRQVEDTLDAGDLVVTVCDSAHEGLGGTVPATDRWLHWAVPDPVPAGTDAAFDGAYAELAQRLRRLAPSVDPAARTA